MRQFDMHMVALACYLIGSGLYVVGTIIMMWLHLKLK